MLRRLASALLLASAACESGEKKMARLLQDQAIACFEDSHAGTADQQAHDMDPTTNRLRSSDTTPLTPSRLLYTRSAALPLVT
jgi:hypothetical protein